MFLDFIYHLSNPNCTHMIWNSWNQITICYSQSIHSDDPK